MPGRFAIANWKMNLPPAGIDGFFRGLRAPSDTTVVIAPPFPYLKEVAARAAAAAQNCADHSSGAFTGEVSAAMVRECGARFVIVGHSERRNIYGENDATVARKLALAIESGLTPIVCVGESQEIRDSGRAGSFVTKQIELTAVSQLQRAEEALIAYEPVWAIGTGRNATGEMVAEMCGTIREAVKRFWPAVSAAVVYGGSATPENVGDLCENGRVEGFLVGGASLDPVKFSAICDMVGHLRQS